MPSRASPSVISGRRHGGAVVAQHRARQAALLERLRQAMRHVLGVLRQVPLQVTGKPRAVVEHTEQHRCLPLAAWREHLARSDVAVPMPQAVNILGLVAAHLTIEQARLGAFGAFSPARCEPSTLVETMSLEEAAQCRVGRQRHQLGLLLGQCEQVVMMKLGAPALVCRILRQHGLAHGGAHRDLLAGVAAPLAPEHADRILPLLAGAVIPALECRDAEAGRLAADRMAPCARGELVELRTQFALARRRRQQLAHHRKAEVRPPLVDPRPSALHHARCSLMPESRTVEHRPGHRRRACSAGRRSPSCSLHRNASGDRQQQTQQGDELCRGVTRKTLEQRIRQPSLVDRRHQCGPRHSPEWARHQRAAPPLPPARNAPPAHAHELRKLPCGGSALSHRATSTTTAPSQALRPRKRNDGGVARLRHRSTAQQKLKRWSQASPSPAGEPRGLRRNFAECSTPPQRAHPAARAAAARSESNARSSL